MNNALIDNYNKDELEKLVIESSSMKELIKKLGYGTCNGSNSSTIKKRLEKFNIDYSHFNKNIKKTYRDDSDIFIENSPVSQKVLRERYKKISISSYKCSICNLGPEWNNKPLTLILDHINGINNDDRLDNLRWVCPNCNQQLPTTGFKNYTYQKNKKCK